MSLEKQLIRHEGYRQHPYKCSAGRVTVGIGRNLDDLGISKEEAEYLLRNDIKRVKGELDIVLPWWRKMDEDRMNVFVNMCFQLGVNRFLQFQRMINAAQDGDYQLAADEMLDSRWAVQCENRAKELAEIMRSATR